MKIDDLRKSWQSMLIEIERVNELNRELTRKIFDDRVTNVRSKVMHKYAIFTIISIVFIPIMPIECMMIFNFDTIPLILVSLFFPYTTVVNALVWYRTRQIDPATMNMKDTLVAFTNLKILRSRLRLMNYIVGIPMVVTLFYYLYHLAPHAFWGGVIGGVIGGAFGFREDFIISREIRELRKTLAEELSDE